jgi:N-acetylglucosamine kinase-like BadF-type ATPase
MVIRAGISASVDVPPNFANTVEEAQQRVTDAVRQALAELGNVRTAVEVTLALTDVEQLRDIDVFTPDYDGRYE